MFSRPTQTYLGRPTPMDPSVRIIFCWAYSKEKEGWLEKEDSTQYLIRELAKVYDVFVCIIGTKMEGWTYGNARYIGCADRDALLVTVLTLAQAHRGDVVFMLNSHDTFDQQVVTCRPDRRPFKTKIMAYCHGQNVVNWHGAIDGHLVSTEHQATYNRRVHGDTTPYHVLPHSPDLEMFKPSKGPKKYDVFYPARRDSNKRVELLERACRIGGFSLKILDGNVVEQRMSRGRRAIQTGDMPLMYQQAKVMCSTSRTEGGSRILVEAMACNVPVVVCSDCRSNADYVRLYGGYAVQPTPEALAKGIRTAIDLPAIDTRSALIEHGVYYQATYAKLRTILDRLVTG